MVWLKDEKEVFPHTCFSPASPFSLSTDASWSRGPPGWLFILSASFWFLLLMVESRKAVSVLDPALVLPLESRERERREKRETERKEEGDREGERESEGEEGASLGILCRPLYPHGTHFPALPPEWKDKSTPV